MQARGVVLLLSAQQEPTPHSSKNLKLSLQVKWSDHNITAVSWVLGFPSRLGFQPEVGAAPVPGGRPEGQCHCRALRGPLAEAQCRCGSTMASYAQGEALGSITRPESVKLECLCLGCHVK